MGNDHPSLLSYKIAYMIDCEMSFKELFFVWIYRKVYFVPSISCKPCAQKPNPQPSISKFKCIYSSVRISRFNLSKCKEEREKKRLAQINSDINLSIPTNCRSYFIIFVISFICERKPFKVQFILSNGGISSIYIFST